MNSRVLMAIMAAVVVAHTAAAEAPPLVFASYLGGNGNEIPQAIAWDDSGNFYVAMSTESTDLLLVDEIMGDQIGRDVYIAKISPSHQLVYATYLGGSEADEIDGLALDSVGNIVLVGHTQSFDFPVVNPIQALKSGDWDAFVTKISPDGQTILFSTFFGGSGGDVPACGGVDASNAMLFSGSTSSTDFPLEGEYEECQGFGGWVFVVRISEAGTLEFSTCLGPASARGCYVQTDGIVHVTGEVASDGYPTVNPVQTYQGWSDAFVSSVGFDGQQAQLLFSTYLGGSLGDFARDVTADAVGDLYVVGGTGSMNFPFANGIQGYAGGYDGFITKLSPGEPQIEYSTFLGGSLDDELDGIVVAADGSAYITGETSSTDFPIIDPIVPASLPSEAVVAKVSPLGSTLVFSSCFGGSHNDRGLSLALHSSGALGVVGDSLSQDLPLVDPVQGYQPQWNAFVFELASEDLPLPGGFGKAAPANGATGQPIDDLTLSWGASADATSYEVCIDTTTNGACDASWASTGAGTSTSLTGLGYETTYSWQVRAVNTSGSTEAEADGGTWWQFTTENQPLPGAFGKIVPPNGATGQPTDLTLSWGASTYAVSYEYCIDTTADNNCDTFWNVVGLDTSAEVHDLADATSYFWQVRAANTQGTTEADGGSWWSFITTPHLFTDGFESGDTTAWSSTGP